jgi:ABC-type glutathione transport system ATPase component
MGRAIVRDPKVFLFDEPLSNLDAKLRVQMRTEIKKVHQKVRTTTVYVTHDQVEAMTLADRVVVMNHGDHRAGRPAAGAVPQPRHALRRRLHRQPGDELPARPRRGRRDPPRRRHRAAHPRGAAQPLRRLAPGGSCCSASAPST